MNVDNGSANTFKTCAFPRTFQSWHRFKIQTPDSIHVLSTNKFIFRRFHSLLLAGPYLSPQTDAFCQLLGIPNDFQARSQPISVTNPDEIPISSDEERVPSVSFATKNPDEIEIADDDF